MICIFTNCLLTGDKINDGNKLATVSSTTILEQSVTFGSHFSTLVVFYLIRHHDSSEDIPKNTNKPYTVSLGKLCGDWVPSNRPVVKAVVLKSHNFYSVLYCDIFSIHSFYSNFIHCNDMITERVYWSTLTKCEKTAENNGLM